MWEPERKTMRKVHCSHGGRGRDGSSSPEQEEASSGLKQGYTLATRLRSQVCFSVTMCLMFVDRRWRWKNQDAHAGKGLNYRSNSP